VILSDHDIVDEWYTLVPDHGGEAPGVLTTVEDNLAAVGVPEMRWTYENIATDIVAALFNQGRDFLVVTLGTFPRYRILVGCEDHGTALGVSLLVARMPSPWRRLCRAFSATDETTRNREAGRLDAFRVADLTAAVAVVRHALDEALRTSLAAVESEFGSFAGVGKTLPWGDDE
jgi:hypothetical protein